VQARAICALTVMNVNWDLAAVRQPLADAESLLPRPWGGGSGLPRGRPLHPLVVVGASMLALYEKQDPDRALALLAGFFDSADPWTRSGARLMHAFTSMNLGRMDGVAEVCAEGLAGFSAIGDRWGMALALVGQAELALLDGEHTRAIAALERAVGLARALTDWEDTSQMYATLAKARSRLGDYDGALADMARAERAAREQGDSESGLWCSYVRAELAWLRGDMAEAGRISRQLDARMVSKNTAMILPFRAQAQNRAALAKIRAGDAVAGWAGLAAALRLALDGQERAAVAVVVDGLAAATLWTDPSPAGAERAAVLLGAAHSIRGVFDRSSVDAPQARDTARQILGDAAFEAAYQRGRALSYSEAVTLAEASAGSHPNG
jgi:tetratricopeptide (TPR) repeat protein